MSRVSRVCRLSRVVSHNGVVGRVKRVGGEWIDRNTWSASTTAQRTNICCWNTY